jgi:hypothetical protein
MHHYIKCQVMYRIYNLKCKSSDFSILRWVLGFTLSSLTINQTDSSNSRSSDQKLSLTWCTGTNIKVHTLHGILKRLLSLKWLIPSKKEVKDLEIIGSRSLSTIRRKFSSLRWSFRNVLECECQEEIFQLCFINIRCTFLFSKILHEQNKKWCVISWI